MNTLMAPLKSAETMTSPRTSGGPVLLSESSYSNCDLIISPGCGAKMAAVTTAECAASETKHVILVSPSQVFIEGVFHCMHQI